MTSILEYLKQLAAKNSSSEEDEKKMERLLRATLFPNARVVVGTVYLEGHGTIQYPPMSINQTAKLLVRLFEANKK